MFVVCSWLIIWCIFFCLVCEVFIVVGNNFCLLKILFVGMYGCCWFCCVCFLVVNVFLGLLFNNFLICGDKLYFVVLLVK